MLYGLRTYSWSSLPGCLSKGKRQHFVGYHLVLGDYGGDADKAWKGYRKALIEEMTQGKDIHDEIIGQTIIGGERFISWVKEKFLRGQKDGEAPAHRAIGRHEAKEEIMEAIVHLSGKTFETIKTEKGTLRQIMMDLLYRQGGMTDAEIGRLFGVVYTAVNQERRRLRMLVEKNRTVRELLYTFEEDISRIEK